MSRRVRREWEAEFVSEYVREAFPGAAARFHVRLGTWPTPLSEPDLTEAELAMLQVRRRWADAVVIFRGRLYVLEGKLRPSEFLKGLGELDLYIHLVANTPELTAYKSLPVVGRLVCTLQDPSVQALARSHGLEFAVYQPTFWASYLEVLTGREKRPIRPEEAALIRERTRV